MITCNNCGQQNDESSRICRYCGVNLALSSQPTQQQGYAPPSSMWSNMPPPAPVQPYGDQPFAAGAMTGYRCPNCGSTAPPLLAKRISTEGWIVFAALLFFCFPLFWIGLLMKKDYRACPTCHTELS